MRNYLLIAGLLLSQTVFAQGGASTKTVSEESNQKSNFQYGVTLQAASVSYQEPGVMKSSGSMYGFNIMGTYTLSNLVILGGNINYLGGTLNYDGAITNNSGKKTPYTSTDKHTITDVTFKSAFLTEISDVVQTSFLFGLGRRTMNDANDSSPYDYARQHNYNYLSLGVQVAIPHDDGATTTPF